jgi:hypothetical protein
MKSFNEWLKSRVVSENDPNEPQPPSFNKILGEDGDDLFTVEVDVNDGEWTVSGPLWANEYVLNGSEPKAGDPMQESPNVAKFNAPGRRLENLPLSLKMAATAWVEKEVQRAIDRYESEDPRDYEDRDDPWRPNWGVHGRESGYYRAD